MPTRITDVATSDWRDVLLGHLRSLIQEADPDIVEEAKWVKQTNPAGVPAWSHDGLVCTGERYRDKVELTFASGASLRVPSRLFNASLDAGTRRAIDLVEGARIDPDAFRQLIREAVEFNVARASKKRRK